MHENAASIPVGQPETGAAASGPVAVPRAPALTLPVIGSDVPAAVVAFGDNRGTARLLLAMMDEELLEAADWQTPWATEADLVERAMGRFVAEQTAGMERFEVELIYTDDPRCLAGWDVDLDMDGLDEKQPAAWFALRPANPFIIAAGHALERLEQASPGLGETVLAWVESLAWRTVDGYTPGFAMHACATFYWNGSDDESEVVMECRENDEEYSGIRKADFLETMPEWALNAASRLTQEELAAAAESHPDPWAREAAAIMLDAPAPKDLPDSRYFNGDSYNPGLVLYWREVEDGPLYQVYNDCYQYASEGEGAELSHVTAFNPARASFGIWLEQIKTIYAALRALDRMVGLIASAGSQQEQSA